MRFQPNEWVTVIDAITAEVGHETIRFPAGMRLMVMDVRPGAIKVIDPDNAEPVWIPADLVRK